MNDNKSGGDLLIDILACPECKNRLRQDESNQRLICDHCRLAYPVIDKIPVMLKEKAEQIK